MDAVEEGFAFGDELHEEVEVADVAAEDGAAMFEGGEEDEGVVHGATAVFGSRMLEARENAGEDGGFAPDCAVGVEDAGGRPVLNDGIDLLDDGGGPRMVRVEAAAQVDQFRLDDRGVPWVALSQQNVKVLREAGLLDVDVDSCVVENLIGQGSARKKIEVGVRPSPQPASVCAEPVDRGGQISIQNRDPREYGRDG